MTNVDPRLDQIIQRADAIRDRRGWADAGELNRELNSDVLACAELVAELAKILRPLGALADVLAVEADLLRSEGIDPAWEGQG